MDQETSCVVCCRVLDVVPGYAQLTRFVALDQCCFANPWGLVDFQQVLINPLALCVEGVLDEQLVGYAIGCREGNDFHLVNLAVEPSLRRQGWGSRLLGQLLLLVGEHGCRRCTLEVRATNDAAVQFYRRQGFQQFAVRLAYYRRPRENALIMRKTIKRL